MTSFLNPNEIAILEEGHRAAQSKKAADRIKTILLLNEGYQYAEIAHILRLNQTTIRRYEKEYRKAGIDGLLENHYQGSIGILNETQEKELKEHLRKQIYSNAKDIIEYVNKTYNKKISIGGMTHLLHRLNFSYKKTKVIPGKANPIKQTIFKISYYLLKTLKKAEDKIYFIDACHPHHNNRPFYGWIPKGEEKAIKTNTGRERINLNGALNIEDMDITILSEETIDRHAVMRLLLSLEEKQPTGIIHGIMDNARYNHHSELKLFLQDHPRIRLHYLPPYSPNLNIIERLWRFFYSKHHDKYFEKFGDFKHDALSFFKNISQYNDELKTLLTDSFQTLPK